MKKINENNYVSFTISGNGWNITVSSFKTALREWNNIPSGTLYGTKYNGDKTLIDSK